MFIDKGQIKTIEIQQLVKSDMCLFAEMVVYTYYKKKIQMIFVEYGINFTSP